MKQLTKEELQEKGEIPTDFGETLSWKYYSYVCEYPVRWKKIILNILFITEVC